MRALVFLLGLLLVTAATAADNGGTEDELQAFERPKRESDVLRAPVAAHLRLTDSRRIAVYEDRRGRRATLFVAKTRTDLCIMLVSSTAVRGVGGAGGGCSPRSSFFQGRHAAATSGRLFAGVVSNQVGRVVLVGSRGVRHPIRPTNDGGFIYDCRAYNVCARLIACVEAYGTRSQLLSRQAWLPDGCRSRP